MRVETRSIAGLMLYHDAEEAEAAALVGDACRQSVELIDELWGLGVPRDCRVYVMTSWLSFLFHSAPWPWRMWLGMTLPLRYARLQKLWAMAGGWAQRYGERRTIGVKPPRLLRGLDTELRQRIFVQREVEDWVQHNTCHELVHAFSDHLRLPIWLHEGLAMVTVDRFAGRATVRADTIEALSRGPGAARPQGGQRPLAVDPESMIYLAVRGYWITRYLAETRPTLLRSLLEQRQPQGVLEGRLAAELGIGKEGFSSGLDGLVIARFQHEVRAHTTEARQQSRQGQADRKGGQR